VGLLARHWQRFDPISSCYHALIDHCTEYEGEAVAHAIDVVFFDLKDTLGEVYRPGQLTVYRSRASRAARWSRTPG
jgi:hypothetical protein